ncbi:hypothetical protein M569_02278 [Genlisea aurea]|uniref:Uncharacterized protein n=1 Tax=Genlisea aurea TaxID=192259 RepID=S8D517_9LAMI|nr:hypothetical protein M569_02278 [Genlisea aurea]
MPSSHTYKSLFTLGYITVSIHAPSRETIRRRTQTNPRRILGCTPINSFPININAGTLYDKEIDISPV